MCASHDAPSLLDITIDEIGRLLQERTTTSEELVDVYLQRIFEVNGRLHAVNEINPDARAIARELDKERALGKVRGPLHGVPILVKDVIATKDKMNNTAGSVCLLGAQVLEEASIITKLRRAGAIILGKANLSEWAGFRSDFHTTSLGWSGYGGQGRGAYREDQDPGGSSSGSAVAVSVGLAAAAVGTETRGSIIIPAEWNNLVGVKPTLGLVSRHMVIALCPRQDVVGPMARTVKDAAYLLTAIAGKDKYENDNSTLDQPFESPPDYTQALSRDALQGARIGVPWNGVLPIFYPAQSPKHLQVIMRSFNEALTVLEAAGATIVHTNFPSLPGKQRENYSENAPTSREQNVNIDMSTASLRNAYPWDGKSTSAYQDPDALLAINTYLSRLDPTSTPIRSLHDIAACTCSNPLEQCPPRDISLWTAALSTTISPNSSEAWNAYQSVYQACGPNGVFAALQNDHLDALVLPSVFSYHFPAYAGSPVVTVPMGAFGDDVGVAWRKEHDPLLRSVMAGPGMTFGLGFFGAKWSEERLLGLAYAFEQRTGWRRRVRPVVVPGRELWGVGGLGGLRVQEDGGGL
ncbi:hypothetical protein MMC17_000396 [Xylographa soralifera]|nr:hypothetical protein [Xylographa soralifera]